MQIQVKKDPTLDDAWEHYSNVKDQSHGTKHIQAVLKNALAIVQSHPTEYDGIDKATLEHAAVLHDIGHQAQLGSSGYHPIIGVGIAKQYVKALPPESQEAVLDAVQHHHGAELPHTEVGKIVRDADRLASTSEPETLAMRAYQYRVDKGLEPDKAAQSAYHYLRHRKLDRLGSRGETAFLTEAGKSMFKENIKNIETATKDYTGFARLINSGLGRDEVSEAYKTASLREDFRILDPANQEIRDRAYMEQNKELLKVFKGNKHITPLIEKELKYVGQINAANKQIEKQENEAVAFDRDMAERKMKLEEKKVNAEILAKKKEAEAAAAPAKKPASKTKTAGIFSFLHDVQVEQKEKTVAVTVPTEHNFIQDVANAAVNIRKKDDFSADRKKLLLAAATTTAGLTALGVGAYVTRNSPYWQAPVKSNMVAALPYIGTGVGLYGAYQHKDDENKTMRNLSLGLAAASAASYPLVVNKLPYNPADAALKASMSAAKPYAAVGTALTYPGIAATAHYGQAIADGEAVKEYLDSDESYENVAKSVNAIREKKVLQTRYPLLRYLNTVPYASKVTNLRIGKPAGELQGKDLAYYTEKHIDKEYAKLKESFEVIHGKASQEEDSNLKQLAQEKVMQMLK